MLFSAKAEYACVAMLELAARYGDPRPVRLADIADKHGISDRFLVQILLQLKGAGLVDSTRGAAGGYQLARSPDDITLADILARHRPARAAARAKDDKLAAADLTSATSAASGTAIVEAQQAVLKDTTLARPARARARECST